MNEYKSGGNEPEDCQVRAIAVCEEEGVSWALFNSLRIHSSEYMVG